MREIKNNTLHDLSFEEHKAVIEAAEILSKAFKVRMYGVSLNPSEKARDKIWGVAFSFNMNEV